MKTITALLLTFSMIIVPDDSLTLLKKAQSKINDHDFLRYDYTILWPNPEGMVDTLTGTATFSKQANRYYEYNYIKTEKGGSDLVYINNELKQILHSDSTIVLFTDEDVAKNKDIIKGNSIVKRSPIALLNHKNWIYKSDTAWTKEKYAIYRAIETDTIVNKNKIYVEWYAFINKATATLDRYERRNFFNGNESQTIAYSFSGYEFGKSRKPLVYTLPAHYRTQMGVKPKLKLIKVGEAAPAFSQKDLNGNLVSTQTMRGKKTLLVFSTINCGYCKLALDHFNKNGYQLSTNLTGAYIFPEDKTEKMSAYAQKVKFPFSTVPDAKQVGKDYGVSAYPIFFLIDEQGVIEKVVTGYNEKFIDSLQR